MNASIRSGSPYVVTVREKMKINIQNPAQVFAVLFFISVSYDVSILMSFIVFKECVRFVHLISFTLSQIPNLSASVAGNQTSCGGNKYLRMSLSDNPVHFL